MHIVLTRGVPKGIGWGGGPKGKGQRGQYPQPVAFWAGTSERLGCTGRRLCVCSSIWGQRRKELVVKIFLFVIVIHSQGKTNFSFTS